MARINRYDQPAQAQFINTYAPYPIEQIMNMDMFKAARIEEGERRADEFMAGLHDFPVDRADEPDYQKRIQGLQTDLDNIVQKHGNLGTAEARRELSALVTKQVRDPWWRAARHNYAARVAGFKALDDAKKVSGATDIDWYDLEKSLHGFVSTEDEMARGNASGMISTPGTFAPVDTRGYFSEQSKNMKASGYTIDRESGKWIVTEGQESLFEDQIASVYGIRTKKIGKNEYAVDYENFEIPAWARTSAAGQKMEREAARVHENLVNYYGEDNEDIPSKEDIFKGLYSEMVSSIVNEKMHSKSTYKLVADPYSLKAYSDRLDNFRDVINTPVLVGGQFSKIKSTRDIETVKQGNDIQISTLKNNRAEFMRNVTENKVGETSVYINNEGVDVTDDVLKYNLEIAQYEEKNRQLDNYVNEVMRSAGYNNPDEIKEFKVIDSYVERKLIEQEERYARNLKAHESDITGLEHPRSKGKKTKDILKDLKKDKSPEAAEAREYYLKNEDRYDAMKGVVNKALGENSKNTSFHLGMRSFGNAKAEDYFGNWYNAYISEGGTPGSKRLGGALVGDVFDLSTGEIIEDPKRLTSYSDKPPLVQGYFYHPERGICLSFRPYDLNNNLTSPVAVEAPMGTVEYLIGEGDLDAAQYIVAEQIRGVFNTYDKVGSAALDLDKDGYWTIPSDGGYTVKIRVFYPFGNEKRPAGGKAIELLYPTDTGGTTSITYDSYGAAAGDFVTKVKSMVNPNK